MPIRTTCDECGATIQVRDDSAGKRVRCKCGAVMRVPAKSEDEDDFLGDLSAGEDEGEAYEPRLPPRASSSRPAAKKPARRSSGPGINVGLIVRISIGLAAVGTVVLIGLAVLGAYTSRQAVARHYKETSEIQKRFYVHVEMQMKEFADNIQNGGASAGQLRQKVQSMKETRDSAIAELNAIQAGTGVKLGPEIVAAMREWIEVEAGFLLSDVPKMLDVLQDQSKSIQERALAVLPQLRDMNVREERANVKLVEMDVKFLEANRIPIPDSTKSKLDTARQRLLTAEANLNIGGTPTAGAPQMVAALPPSTTPFQQPVAGGVPGVPPGAAPGGGLVPQQPPMQGQPQGVPAGVPPKVGFVPPQPPGQGQPGGPPPGFPPPGFPPGVGPSTERERVNPAKEKPPEETVPVRSEGQLKRGMHVWEKNFFARGWIVVEITGSNSVTGFLEGLPLGTEGSTWASTLKLEDLRVDPQEFEREDLADVPSIAAELKEAFGDRKAGWYAGPPLTADAKVKKGERYLVKATIGWTEVQIFSAPRNGRARVRDVKFDRFQDVSLTDLFEIP